ncbi:hypothetical protein MASR1M107_10760 [Ignavibacteriales bacterium]
MKTKVLIPVLLFTFWATGCYTQFETQQPEAKEIEVEVVKVETDDTNSDAIDTTVVSSNENESNYDITIKRYKYIEEDDYWSRPVVSVNIGYGYSYVWDNFCYDPFWAWYYNPYIYYPRWVYHPWYYWYDPYPYYYGWNYNHGYHHGGSYGYNSGFSKYKYRDREISSIRGRDGGRGSRGDGSGARTPGITGGNDQVAKRSGVRNDGSRNGSGATDDEVKTERKRGGFDTWNRDEEPVVKRNSGREVTKRDGVRSGDRTDGTGRENKSVEKKTTETK